MADTCVARVPVFAALTAEDQRQVATLARSAHLARGDVASSPDDDAARLLVVHSGRLSVIRVSPSGAEQLVRVLEPGEFTGETAVFSRRPPDTHTVALEAASVCVFRHDDLEDLVRRHPDIGLRMLAAVSERLADTEDRLNALGSRDVEARLARYLLGLPTSWRDGAATVTLPLAKKDVASLLDTSPESFSRALAALTGRGLVAVGAGRAVTIADPAGLERLAEG